VTLELTDEEICAVRIERDHAEKQCSPFDLCLISALFKLQAGKMKAELFAGFDMPESLPDETNEQYTDRLTGADKTGKCPYPEYRNRQCSIGYHSECTDPKGEQCKCPCHWTDDQWLEAAKDWFSREGKG